MFRRIVIGDQERVVLIRNGQFERILGPGVHWLVTFGSRVDTQRHDLQNPEFESEWAGYLLAERRDVVKRWFTTVSTTDGQIAVLYLDGRLHRVLGPRRSVLLWRGPFAYRVELFDARMNPEVPARLIPALARHGGDVCAMLTAVEEGKRGLLFVGGKLQRELAPGMYGFWKATALPLVEDIGTRLRVIELPGRAEPFGVREAAGAEFAHTTLPHHPATVARSV